MLAQYVTTAIGVTRTPEVESTKGKRCHSPLLSGGFQQVPLPYMVSSVKKPSRGRMQVGRNRRQLVCQERKL